jgi:hypothetical protein
MRRKARPTARSRAPRRETPAGGGQLALWAVDEVTPARADEHAPAASGDRGRPTVGSTPAASAAARDLGGWVRREWRGLDKRAYALAWIAHLRGGGPVPQAPAVLSTLDAQLIRMRIAAAFPDLRPGTAGRAVSSPEQAAAGGAGLAARLAPAPGTGQEPSEASPVRPIGEPAGEALFIVPGAGLPEGTVPLAEPTPWDGPRRPERLLYPDGTPLTIRNQGEDADRTWPGTAAGAAPATGDHTPGRLQVVRWASGRCSLIHPALVSHQGADPYGCPIATMVLELAPRDEEFSANFDSVFARWRAALVTRFEPLGVAPRPRRGPRRPDHLGA